MSNIRDLSDTIKPKSDQLNADDLLTSEKTVIITAVKRGGNEDPVIINYQGDDGRPYKPCKTMRRALIALWGKDGEKWIGQSMTLYCDPTVKWAGREVGGIRISHMTGIEKAQKLMLTTTRGKRSEYIIKPLKPQEKKPYPNFEKGLTKMQELIVSGENTPEQIIAKCEAKYSLTKDQRDTIRAFEVKEDNVEPEPQKPTESQQASKQGEPSKPSDDVEVDYDKLFND